MENNEIYIDGVDVAGCDYMYDNEDLNYICQNGIGTCICRENKNCYYKQLKRLEFELKVTKADYEASEQENAKLKQTLQEIKAIAEKEIKELTDSAINGGRYLEILDLITKAEEE